LAQFDPVRSALSATVRRLRRFDVVDRQGFGRPTVAMSGVMPAGWDVIASEVSYYSSRSCPVMSVTTSFRVASPDRRVGLELFPAAYLVWFDDPSAEVMYGSSSAAGGGCERGPLMDAPTFVRHRLLPRYRTGGVVVSLEPLPLVGGALERRARRVTSPNQSLRVLRTDASLVRVLYPSHGTEERVLVLSMDQGQTFDPRNAGGPPQQWASYRPFIVGMWAPDGTWETHRSTFQLIVGSLMQDTSWLEKQTQLNVAMGRTLTRAARDRRLLWDATVDLANPTLLGALRNHDTGEDAFPVTLWAGATARYAFDSSVRRAWTSPDGEILVSDDERVDAPIPGLRPLRPGTELLPGEAVEAADHDGETRLAAPRGGTLSAASGPSDTSGLTGTGAAYPAPVTRSILAHPGGLATPD